MKARANFWIGVTVGALIAAAVLFSIYYVPRKGITFGKEPISFTVVLAEANGLHAGSPVYISGIEAGELTDVRISELPNLGYRVLATAEVFDGERFGPMLTTGSAYEVSRSGLLGEMTLAITPGGEGEPLQQGALVDGTPPMDFTRMVDDVAHITKRLADFMDGREAGDPSLRRAFVELQAALQNIRAFSEKLPGN